MSDEPTLFTCDVCGTEFPPDPACMLEGGWSMEHEGPEGEEWKHGDHHPVLSAEDRERAKAEMRIDDPTLDRLLAGEEVDVWMCMCKPCQDREFAEATDNEP
jgi:hypothetical protein